MAVELKAGQIWRDHSNAWEMRALEVIGSNVCYEYRYLRDGRYDTWVLAPRLCLVSDFTSHCGLAYDPN